jgi:photosystem II stability/assembly factor-like uncharacterized protein
MRSIVKFFLILFYCSSANAQFNTDYFNKLQSEKINSSDKIEWIQFGPGMAGYCEEFWCHPTDENVMFQSPDMYNSYGTWDNGKSWQTIKDVDGTGKDMRRIQSIVFSHQNSNFGHAIDVRGELYKTTDQGRTWQFVRDMGGKHAEMTVDPSDDNNWYIGGGDFWNIKANHRKQSDLLGYVYKYSDYGQIFKSTDKGKTWQKKKTGLPSTLDVGRIIVDPRDSNIIIIGTNSGVYRSTDKGETWSSSANGLPNNLPRDITSFFDAGTNEYILFLIEQTFFEDQGNTVSSKGGVYKSTDGGINWTNMSGNLGLDLTQVNNYSTTTKYWRSIAFWFDLTQNEAKAKFTQYPSQIFPVYNRIKVNPLDKNEIYLCHNVKHDYSFGPGDLWKTEDGGQTWITTARSGNYWKEEKNKSYWQNRNNPLGVNTQFAHLGAEKIDSDETYGNRFLELNSKGEVFICLDQQIMRSNNKGTSWQQVDDFETSTGSKAWVGRGASNLPGRFMLLETGIKDRKLFCSGEHGLWKSVELGNYPDKNAVAVEQIEGQVNHQGAHSIASVAVNPKNPNEIYTLQFRQNHRGYFRKSTDGGKTWDNLSYPVQYGGNLSSDNLFQYSLTIDFDNPNNIYFTVVSNPIAEVSSKLLPSDFKDIGVYRSQDGGNTWSIENNGLPTNASVRRIKMDPKNTTTLYAALNENKNNEPGGLYKTTDKANNWEKITIPNTIKSVNNIFIDRNTGYLFISCGGYEGDFAEGGVWRSKDEGINWEKIFDMPYVWQTETSPVNPNIITVNVPLQHENKGATTFNPGAYISMDGGSTWLKANKNLGQPDTITDLKPDPEIEGVFWCALKGSGWAKAIYKNSESTIKVKSIGNSCPGANSGSIQLSSLTNDNYTVILKGNTIEKTINFTNETQLENLASGNYTIKITSTENTSLTEEYIVNISEPSNLMVAKSEVINNKISYNLSGGNSYKITLNGKTQTTTKSTIELSLSSGKNTVEIQSDSECQGKYHENIKNFNRISCYPSPFKDFIKINLVTDSSEKATIILYNFQGKSIIHKTIPVINQTILLNTGAIETGQYILSLETKNTLEKIQITKIQ